MKTWKSTKRQDRAIATPGIQMTVHLNNTSLASKLRNNSKLWNSALCFLLMTLDATKIPKPIVNDTKKNILGAIEAMGGGARTKIEWFNNIINEKKIVIPLREDAVRKRIDYTSNNRCFSEFVANIDLIDQALWILESLSISLLISQKVVNKQQMEVMNLLHATEKVINAEYRRVTGLLKSDGKVNEVAVAMPVDKNVIPEPLNHPLIGIEGVHKVKNELVMVDHPVRSYADSKPSEKKDAVSTVDATSATEEQ